MEVLEVWGLQGSQDRCEERSEGAGEAVSPPSDPREEPGGAKESKSTLWRQWVPKVRQEEANMVPGKGRSDAKSCDEVA